MSPCAVSPDARRFPLTGLAVLLLAGSLPYLGTFSAPMVFDSRDHIVDRDLFRNFSPFSQFRSAPRWVADNTFAVNRRWGGQAPAGYHAVNILIHVAAGLVLWGVLRRTLASERLAPTLREWSEPVALAAAAMWVAHPLQTESVTYIIQRYESLMGLCYLLTLYCFIRSAGSPRPAVWLTASFACCVLGLRSKEVMVTAPLLVLWYDRVFISRNWRELVRRRWGYYAAVGAAWIWLMLPLFGDVTGGLYARFVPPPAGAPLKPRSTIIDVPGVTPIDYALTQPGVILHYLRLAFWPRGQCLDHDWPLAETAEAIQLPLVVIGTLLVLVVCHLRRQPAWAYLGGWFLVILAPTSSIVPIQDLACEHRMYLPLAAVTTAVAVGLFATGGEIPWLRLPGVWTLLVTGLVAALGVATFVRNRDYRSEAVVWRSVVSQRPKNVRARLGLGIALADEGQPAAAAEEFLAAIELQPLELRAYYQAARELVAVAKFPAAEELLQRALTLRPDYAKARYELAIVFRRQGKIGPAVDELRRVVAERPDLEEAAQDLAWILATSPEDDLRDGKTALRLAERACASTSNPSVAWLDRLAAAQAETGDFAAAAATAQIALRQAEVEENAALAEGLRRRLDLYQQQQPYRDVALTVPPTADAM